MLGLPKSTKFNKRIPKQKFYEQLDMAPALRKAFAEQVRLIYWRNKLAPTTMNIAAGERVNEIEVFEVRLNHPNLDEAVLKQIDKAIPYHILFLLEFEGDYQAWIGYKEVVESGKNVFKVSKYYHTEWLTEDGLLLKLEGLNIDTIYDNFVRQIAGDVLQVGKSESLKDAVERAEKRQQFEKQIAALETKMRKEKQLNRQIEMNSELKMLRKELEGICK